MGKVVAVEYLSIDGVMEEPRWSRPYFNDKVAKFQYNNQFESSALLLGGPGRQPSAAGSPYLPACRVPVVPARPPGHAPDRRWRRRCAG